MALTEIEFKPKCSSEVATRVGPTCSDDARRFLEAWHSLSPSFREELTRRIVEAAQHDDVRWLELHATVAGIEAQNKKLMALIVELLDPWTEITPRVRALLDAAGVEVKSSVATVDRTITLDQGLTKLCDGEDE